MQRVERRKSGIAQRMNFFEIYRNKGLFKKEEFEQLLFECLAKSKDQELP